MTTEAPKKRGRPKKVDVAFEEKASKSTPTAVKKRATPDLEVPLSKSKPAKKSTATPKIVSAKAPALSAKSKKTTVPLPKPETIAISTKSARKVPQPTAIIPPSVPSSSQVSSTSTPALASGREDSLKSKGTTNNLIPLHLPSLTSPLSDPARGTLSITEAISVGPVAHAVNSISGLKPTPSLFDMPSIYRHPALMSRLGALEPRTGESSAQASETRPLSTTQRATAKQSSTNSVNVPKAAAGRALSSVPPTQKAPLPPLPHRKYQPPITSTAAEPSNAGSMPGLGKHLTYKGASRRITGILVGTPLMIVTSYFLWERGERSVRPMLSATADNSQVVEGKEQRQVMRDQG